MKGNYISFRMVPKHHLKVRCVWNVGTSNHVFQESVGT